MKKAYIQPELTTMDMDMDRTILVGSDNNYWKKPDPPEEGCQNNWWCGK